MHDNRKALVSMNLSSLESTYLSYLENTWPKSNWSTIIQSCSIRINSYTTQMERVKNLGLLANKNPKNQQLQESPHESRIYSTRACVELSKREGREEDRVGRRGICTWRSRIEAGWDSSRRRGRRRRHGPTNPSKEKSDEEKGMEKGKGIRWRSGGKRGGGVPVAVVGLASGTTREITLVSPLRRSRASRATRGQLPVPSV
jgi:hypothetical protein